MDCIVHRVAKIQTRLSDFHRTSLIAQVVKNLPVMQEISVQSLGWEDPLEKGKATLSSILAWRIPWTFCLWGSKESDMTARLSVSLSRDVSYFYF